MSGFIIFYLVLAFVSLVVTMSHIVSDNYPRTETFSKGKDLFALLFGLAFAVFGILALMP